MIDGVLHYDNAFACRFTRSDRSYERPFWLITVVKQTEWHTMVDLAAAGFFIGATLPEDSRAILSSIAIRMDDRNQRRWTGSLQYETSGETDDNPLNAPPDISVDRESYTERVEFDIDDKPIVNSAGEPFDEPPEVTRSRVVLTITRNEATDAWVGLSNDFTDCVNSDPFWIAGPGYARCKVISGQNFFFNGLQYWRVKYVIELDRRGFKKRVLDRGYSFLATDFQLNNQGRWGKRYVSQVPILNADGSRIDKPVLLDGQGRRLESGASPVFKEYNVDERRPFSVLRLPV
jgi:hypothetical protein